MAYTVIARKWRPKTFDEIVGQKHVSQTLKNAIANSRIAHAYLFSGTRGVGKTTTARVMAKALNCESGPTPTPCNQCIECEEINSGRAVDVIEIDGASNRGIDEIRELREKAIYSSARGRYKIYIIDEVHMLTREAFNALLKILEEPPAHIIFMFATTEINKIPITILSRCQSFVLKRISIQEIVGQLEMICEKEGIHIKNEELFLIAKSAEGSMRDAQGLVDQIVSFAGKDIKREDVMTILGSVEQTVFKGLLEGINRQDPNTVLKALKELTYQGSDIGLFVRDLLEFVRSLMITKVTEDPYSLIELPKDRVDEIKELASEFTDEELHQIFDILSRTESEIGYHSDPVLLLEMTFLKLVKIRSLKSVENIIERLDRLEKSFSEKGDIPVTEKPVKKEEKKSEAEPVPLPQEEEIQSGRFEGKEELDRLWAKVIERSEKKKKWLPSVLSNLTPISLEGGVLEIGFLKKNSFCKDSVKDNRKLISEAIHEVVGKEVKLKINDILIEKDNGTNEDEVTVEDDASEGEVLKETLEIFGGEVVKEKRIRDK